MKNYIYILWLIGIFGMSACVSSKKYQASLSESLRLRQDSSQLATNNVALRQELEEESAEGVRQDYKIKSQQETLAQKEQRIQELRQKMLEQREQMNRLKESILDALVDFEPDELSVYKKEGEIYVSLSDQLLFASNSAWLGKEGKEALQKLSPVLERYPDLGITIRGHTDPLDVKEGGAYLDNWDLSVSRANAVVRVLVENGITPNRITASGRASFDPVNANDTEEERARNRRTEIVLTPDLTEILETF